MISRIPALEFMQHLVGSYLSTDGLAALSIARVGYGQALEFRLSDKVQFYGVSGASGEAVELFAQVGLPNVVRLTGRLASKDEIHFESSDLPLSIVIAQADNVLTFTVVLHNQPARSHVLQRA